MNRLLFLSLLLLCLAHPVKGADVNVDSLRTVAADESQHDTLRADALWRIAKTHMLASVDTAYRILDQSMALLDGYETSKVYVGAMIVRGGCEYTEGNYEAALKIWTRAKKLAEQGQYLDEKYLSISNVAQYYRATGDYEKALSLSRKVLPYYRTKGDDVSRGNVLNTIATVYDKQGKVEEAERYFYKALTVRERAKDLKGVGSSKIGLANLYRLQGRYEEALELYFSAMDIYEKINSISGKCSCENNLGILYKHLGELELSRKYYERSIRNCELVGNQSVKASAIMNLGGVYAATNNFAQALEQFKMSMEIHEKQGNKSAMATAYSNVAVAYWSLDQKEKALEYMEKNLGMFQELGIASGELRALRNLGVMAFQSGEYGKAENYSNQVAERAGELGELEVVLGNAQLRYGIYKKQKKFKESFEQHVYYIHLKDSMEGAKSKAQTLKLEAKHEYEVKAAQDSVRRLEDARVYEARLQAQEAEKERLKAENLRKAEEKKKSNQQMVGAAVGLALSLVLALLAFRGYRNKQRANEVISGQKEEVQREKALAEEQKALVEEKNKEILDSIYYAKNLQEAILPNLNEMQRWLPESFIFYQPKDIVAGDFYWADKVENKILLAVADCTGHGVPGAMVSVVCSNALNKSVLEEGETDPGRILDRTTELVTERFGGGEEEVKDGMDIAFCVLDRESREVHYSGANNPLWILRKDQDEVEEIKATKQPGGKYASRKPFQSHTIQLAEGDTVFMFTDGFPDQFGGPRGKKYKYARFKDLLAKCKAKGLSNMNERLMDELKTWSGSLEQIDDICIIGFQI